MGRFMRNLLRFRFLPLLLLLSLAGACTDDNEPPKLVAVANETAALHQVRFGGTDFGAVAADTVTGYEEVGDGEQAVMVDGRQVWSDSLGSDNVGGMWTLYLQEAGGQLLVGVSIDE